MANRTRDRDHPWNESETLTYNGFGELTGLTATCNGQVLFSEQYSPPASRFDKLGRITQKVETIGGTTTTFNYTYDLAGRLWIVQTGSTTATYTYDENGNRKSAPGLATSPTYDDQDRLTQYGNTTYTYTANGELKSKAVNGQTTAYTYDEFGNLLSVTLPAGSLIEYIIDGQNRRIGKKVGGSLVKEFLYQDRLKPIAELDPRTNQVVSRFVYASRRNVPDYMIKDGVTFRILTDQLGSPRLLVNVLTGAIVQRMDYDEFGRVTQDTNPGFQPFGFAGGIYDQDTHLTRFGARDYDAETGRWTAKDPVIFGYDKSIHYYCYVRNNPMNLRLGPYPRGSSMCRVWEFSLTFFRSIRN